MTQQQPTWLDRTEYPFTSRYFDINGQRMHYIDEGQGETLLFVHGTPSWSFEYRHLIKNLRAGNRCVAIDHIGFGLSDKPVEYDYSTQNHASTLEQFILNNDLQDITLVVHDFGGPIGLQAAINHPDRIKRMVIMNTWMWSSEGEPEYEKFSKVLRSPILPFLYRKLNFSARFILPRSFGDHKPNRKILQHYRKPFGNSKEREGTLAFAHSLLNDQQWFESLWQQRSAISGKPVLLIWGMKDPVILPKNLKRFEEGFTNTSTVKLDACGHFPQEEEPGEVVGFVKKWLNGLPKR